MGRGPTASIDVKAKRNSEKGGGNTAAIMGQDGDARIVYMAGDVDENSISQVVAHMLHLSSVSQKPIQFVISTYGGAVDEMFSLYDVIKFLPCPVHTIGLGKIMSAGVLLLASGEKGKRMIGKNSRIMIHSMSGSAAGNIFEVLNEASEMKRMQDLMVSLLCKETKMPKSEVEKIMKMGHDFYLTSDQALKYGIVDKIIGDGE